MKLPVRYYKNFPKGNPIGHFNEIIELDPENTALLIIDVYGKGFRENERDESKLPSLYLPDEDTEMIVKDLIPRVKKAAKSIDLKVIYLTNYLSPAMGPENEWRKMSIRTHGVDVLEAWTIPNEILIHSDVIAPSLGDTLIEKQMYSGFFETELESALRNANIKNLVVVGFDANICLKYTLVDALYRNFQIIVLRDCIRTMEFPETVEGGWANFMTVRHIETAIGYTSTSQEFIGASI